MGLTCLWMVWFVCLCVCGEGGVGGGVSSGVLVSKRSVLSYQDTFLMFIKTRGGFNKKQEVLICCLYF